MTSGQGNDSIALHPSELTDHILYRLRASVGMWGAIALGTALGFGSLLVDETDVESRVNHWIRTGLIASGLGAAALAFVMKESVVQRSLITLDAADISAASRQQRYYEAMKPGAAGALLELPAEPWAPDLFDWGRLVVEPDRFPHLILLGATGDGKTTLAEWLHSAMDAEPIAVHPHWQPSDDPTDPADFAYCTQVIGGGRDFPAITAFLAGLHQAMNTRSQMTKAAMRSQPILATAIDELPAIAKNCGEGTTEQIISLLFEARKFRIRLLLLAQADSVKILGLEGQGAVRENLTYIRLGSYAIDHARWLVNKKLAAPELVEWLEAQARPCMVEDQPARVPTIRKGQSLNGPRLSLPVGSGGEAGGRQVVSTHTGGVPHGDSSPLDAGASTDPPPAPTFDPFVEEIDPDEFQRVVNLKQGGANQDEVIKAVWSAFKSGTDPRYQAARRKYRRILKKAQLD
ncbi:MAG: hypothetical protein AAFX78_19210 [Cyanobacteria bacterium J06638_20]